MTTGDVRDVWRGYVDTLPLDHAHRAIMPDAFMFGGRGALADELADLVLAGKKRATTSLPIEYAADEPLPQAGSLSIVLRGDSTPAAIIEYIDVKSMPFDQVTEAYAAIEGEGDGSLAYWRAAHREYFREVCERVGMHFDERATVICQVFRMVWP